MKAASRPALSATRLRGAFARVYCSGDVAADVTDVSGRTRAGLLHTVLVEVVTAAKHHNAGTFIRRTQL